MALERNGRCNMMDPILKESHLFSAQNSRLQGLYPSQCFLGCQPHCWLSSVSSPLPFNSARGGVPQRNKTARCPPAALVFWWKCNANESCVGDCDTRPSGNFCARRLKQLKLSQEEDIFEEMTRVLSISLHLKKVNSNLSFFDTWVNEMTFQTIPQRNSWFKKIIIIKVAKREKTCWSKMTVASFQYEFSNNGKSKNRNYSQHQSGLQVVFSSPSAVAHFILV